MPETLDDSAVTWCTGQYTQLQVIYLLNYDFLVNNSQRVDHYQPIRYAA